MKCTLLFSPRVDLGFKTAFLSVIAFFLAIAHAEATTYVGSPSNPSGLNAALQSAYSSGATDITINTGTYTFPSGPTTCISLTNWSNVTIHATNCTFISPNNAIIVAMQSCVNVTVTGGIYRFALPAYTQGKVVAVGTAIPPGGTVAQAYADWQIDAGYPCANDSNQITNSGAGLFAVDGSTGVLRRGDQSNVIFQALTTSRYRCFFANVNGNLQTDYTYVGDSLLSRYNNGTLHQFRPQFCSNCTISNVTVQNSAFAPFFEEAGAGTRYLSNIIQPGPMPAGATAPQLVSAAADGMHLTDSNPGPDIENVVFQGIVLDDCIAIHGAGGTVLGSNPANNTVTLDNTAYMYLAVGQPIRFALNDFVAQAIVTAITPVNSTSRIVTLDRSLNVPQYAAYFNPAATGAGYKIINCDIGRSVSGGIRAKADNGLIQGCTISDCALGIKLGPEGTSGIDLNTGGTATFEAGYVWNVTVKGNTFSNNRSYGMFVWRTYLQKPSPAPREYNTAQANQHIVIQDNSFADVADQFDLWLANATDVIVVNNTFTNLSKPALCNTNVSNLVFSGNKVTTAGGSNYQIVTNDASTSNVAVTNTTFNDSGGYTSADSVTGSKIVESNGATNITLNGQEVGNFVTPGLYKLVSQTYVSNPLEVYGYNTGTGQVDDLATDAKQGNQRWEFADDGNGGYLLEPDFDRNVCLNVYGSHMISGNKVVSYVNGNSTNERWLIASCGGGHFKIAAAANPNFVLDCNAAGTQLAGINTYAASNTNQQWIITKADPVVPGAIYSFVSQANTSEAIDAYANPPGQPGTRPALYPASTSYLNQRWIAMDVGNGYYAFSSANSWLQNLDVTGGATANGTPIQLTDYTSTDPLADQKFLIDRATMQPDNGVYLIVPAIAPSTAVSLHGSSTTTGTQLELQPKTFTSTQEWQLRTQ